MKKFFKIAGIALAVLVVLIVAVSLLSGNDDGYDAPRQPGIDQGNTSSPPALTGDAPAWSSPFRPTTRALSFDAVEPSFTSSDSNINMIEINQGLSYGFDTDTGGFYLMENFAAGKETAVFVSFAQPIGSYGEALLSVERDGQFVAQLVPAAAPDDRTLLFQPKNTADVDHWGEGAYTFTFEIDGSRAVRTANFFESIPMKVLAVPVLANYSGRVVACEGDWRNGVQMILATFPVARADVEYILAPELDLSSDWYDLDTDEGQYYVWEALSNLQTRNNDYTAIVGFIRDAADYGTMLGYTFGMPTSIVVESEPDMLATVVHEIAHCYRIGDEYDGGSLNEPVNAAPYGMEGRDMNTREPTIATKRAVVSGEDVGLSGTGSVIYHEQRAYWVEGRTMLGAVTSYMGSGTGADSFTMWTTSEIWDHLFRVFVGHSAEPGSGAAGPGPASGGGGGTRHDDGNHWGQCYECYDDVYSPDLYVECWDCWDFVQVTGVEFTCQGCYTQWAFDDYYDDYYEEYDVYIECSSCYYFLWLETFQSFNRSAGQMGKAAKPVVVMDITGYIDAGGAFVADPWYIYEADASALSSGRDGAYTVNIYDAAGSLISATSFDVETHSQVRTQDGAVLVEKDRVPVNVTARFHENAAKIALQHGEREIYSRLVSNNTPEVAFTGLTDHQMLPDNVTLTWDAFDADGDDLYFEIWYCADGDFYHVASNITGNSYELDMTKYPGTDEGYFYIYATDGVLTGASDSPWVSVPYKAPEIFSVQADIPEVKVTEEIYFDVDIYDLQDGWLWSVDQVVWRLDGKEFMSGSTLWVWPYELPPGTHTFTCTAVNSVGLSVSMDFTFHIIDDESDLPDDWSRGDLVNALSSGFVASLARIDEPVTRGQYAGLMTLLFAYMSEGEVPYPDYIDGLVSDSGEDDYNEFLMVYLGVMDAPDGRFEPNRTLTEQDAALIMYRVSALADPDYFSIDTGESQILEWLEDVGVFDADGPNAYRAAERLSNRLALVRISRLFDAVFGQGP